MPVRVRTAARLHVGFCNLSLTRERLYGGIGVAIDRPRTIVVAEPAPSVQAPEGPAEWYARQSVDLLDVAGAEVRLEEALPRHVGLGSGTQLALAIHTAIARAHGRAPAVRELAPWLDRGGRSGVGVATFERGGFVLDAGHPTDQFTHERPAPGSWSVPRVVARHDLPGDWRFLVVIPEIEPGRSEADEDDSMRAIVEGADPAIGEAIAVTVVDRLLPGLADGDVTTVGTAITAIDRHTGQCFASEQGGRHRPAVATVLEGLTESAAIDGAGQSSWGPAVYGLTEVDRADDARDAGTAALDAADLEGEVLLASPRHRGARIED